MGSISNGHFEFLPGYIGKNIADVGKDFKCSGSFGSSVIYKNQDGMRLLVKEDGTISFAYHDNPSA